MNLYVIGNGFDLHHGIASSFRDFAAYVKINQPDVAEAVEQYLPAVGENWWNLEAALAEIDYDGVIQDCECFLTPYGAEDFRASAYHDFECEIDRIASNLSSNLRRAFSEWIHRVEIPGSAAAKMALDPAASFLTFNYTETLTKVYQIPGSQIWHVHGRVPCEASELVLGHARKVGQRDYDPRLHEHEDGDTREVQGFLRLDEYFDDTFKASDRIILENAKRFEAMRTVSEVIVLGHSLSEVDACYFEAVAQHVDMSRVKWTATYYGEEERGDIAHAIAALGGAWTSREHHYDGEARVKVMRGTLAYWCCWCCLDWASKWPDTVTHLQ